jgi:hypothetical protein
MPEVRWVAGQGRGGDGVDVLRHGAAAPVDIEEVAKIGRHAEVRGLLLFTWWLLISPWGCF